MAAPRLRGRGICRRPVRRRHRIPLKGARIDPPLHQVASGGPLVRDAGPASRTARQVVPQNFSCLGPSQAAVLSQYSHYWLVTNTPGQPLLAGQNTPGHQDEAVGPVGPDRADVLNLTGHSSVSGPYALPDEGQFLVLDVPVLLLPDMLQDLPDVLQDAGEVCGSCVHGGGDGPAGSS